MRYTEKEHKKMKKLMEEKKKVPQTTTIRKPKQEEKEVPAWFNQNIENVEPTNTEQEEMEKILRELV